MWGEKNLYCMSRYCQIKYLYLSAKSKRIKASPKDKYAHA